jgi:hypothetical protein
MTHLRKPETWEDLLRPRSVPLVPLRNPMPDSDKPPSVAPRLWALVSSVARSVLERCLETWRFWVALELTLALAYLALSRL